MPLGKPIPGETRNATVRVNKSDTKIQPDRRLMKICSRNWECEMSGEKLQGNEFWFYSQSTSRVIRIFEI